MNNAKNTIRINLSEHLSPEAIKRLNEAAKNKECTLSEYLEQLLEQEATKTLNRKSESNIIEVNFPRPPERKPGRPKKVSDNVLRYDQEKNNESTDTTHRISDMTYPYWWRMIVRECPRADMLHSIVGLLAEELTEYDRQFNSIGDNLAISPGELQAAVKSATPYPLVELRKFALSLVQIVERGRAQFRAAGYWPSRKYEPRKLVEWATGKPHPYLDCLEQ